MNTYFIKAAKGFNFRATVFSHGWIDLAPFKLLSHKGSFQYVSDVGRRKAIDVWVDFKKNKVQCNTDVDLLNEEIEYIKKEVLWMLRLEEDFNPFFQLCKKYKKEGIVKNNMARMLRASTVFEDLIKLILTTNCSWSLTKSMVQKLCHHTGKSTANKNHAFPSLKQMSKKNEQFYRDTIRCGYRAPYLVSLCTYLNENKIDVESWKHWAGTPSELKKEIVKIPGAGSYVADTLLRYLGHYDFLGLDSSIRKGIELKFGKKITDKDIQKKYKKFHPYSGLVLWFDVSKNWLNDEAADAWIKVPK